MSEAGSGNRVACDNCFQLRNCLWDGLAIEKVLQFDHMILHRRPYHRRRSVVTAGQKSQGLCIVRSGCLKSYLINEQGELQVTGFYLPGELLCIDDMASGIYPFYVEALEVSSICTIPPAAMEKIVASHPEFLQQVLKKISRNTRREHEMMAVLAKMNPKQRLAAFLLDIAERISPCRKAGECEFVFCMRRCDIASYLGVAPETISRWLSEFQKRNFLAVQHRRITIKNFDGLSELVSHSGVAEFLPVNTAMR